jgi:hypothetical protein
VTEPSGAHRLSVPPRTSTASTEPSSIATGPSGNRSPLAKTLLFGVGKRRIEVSAITVPVDVISVSSGH